MKSLSLLVLLFAAVSVRAQTGAPSPVLLSLVEAEWAFARAALEKGVEEAFYEFFAEDGVGFRPQAFNSREDYRNNPPPSGPPPTLLTWGPLWADISAAGDLGYTTGPIVIKDTTAAAKPLGYGYYFSVWQKQADGAWKVRADMGIPTPEPAKETTLRFPTATAGQAPTSEARTQDALADIERAFAEQVAADGVAAAFAQVLDVESRFHEPRHLPFLGKDAILAHLAGEQRPLTWQPEATGVAVSNDLGFTYGPYAFAATGEIEGEKGYYLHVWRRSAEGTWRLVARVVNKERR